MKRNLSAAKRSFKLPEPFVISRGSKSTSEVVIVQIQDGRQQVHRHLRLLSTLESDFRIPDFFELVRGK